MKGNWRELQGKAKQQWGNFTDDDLEAAAGRRDEFVGKIQARYGKSREEAEKEVDAWSARC